MDIFFNYQKNKIRYIDKGKGDCIVLLHGFTESLEIWDDLIKELSSNYRLITFDLPGHGKSDLCNEINTMEFMADVLKALIDYLKINKILLIGHSMGGYVALEFANKYPKSLIGLGLFHSHAFQDSEEAKKNRDRLINIIKANKFDFVSQFIPDLFSPENRIKYKLKIKELIDRSLLYTTNSGLIASLEGMKARKCKQQTLSKLSLPIFYIIGKKDPRIESAKVVSQAMLSAECWLQVLDIGHMGYIEAQEETFSFIKAFANHIFR